MRVELLIFLFCLIALVSNKGLKLEFSWTRITYQWPRDGQYLKRQTKTESRYRGSGGGGRGSDVITFEGMTNANEFEVSTQGGRESREPPNNIDYQFVNNIPMGTNVWRNKLFVTVPRRRLGVPSTLNYVPLDSPQKQNVPLIPYPNWGINLYPGPRENFVSVYRVGVDPCDRLWFVDTGIIETPGNTTIVKPSEIIIIDLKTDRIVQRYSIPADQVTPTSNLASVVIDVTEDTCLNAYAYIPDLGGYGLIVYSLRDNRSWKVRHNYFYLEPLSGEFYIAGHHFQWNDGIFSVELTDLKKDGYRDMYFHSMAGTNMYKVSTKILRNETMATRSYHEDDFQLIGNRGPNSQTSSADLHKPTNIMFLGLVNENALGCVNMNLMTAGVVQKDDQRMIYPSDVKVVKDRVYVLTNTMPEFLYGRLNYDEVNFRVWQNTVQEAVEGTKCAHPRPSRPY
ncbi:unnamed protein product [Acanthoscelides obtectus]|uniref:Uncharacterized protein n=1 Tax=Acanthoscelides obtectus TaxID=200917 RepID=A0A9P0LMS4_ACAOB|nr:unnamed protein product [Acanthoscelides obtectus]CAK1640861.1 L-dopachrome tautomerase yellow-f2 [Acanthoscelides obtectus]